MTESLPRDGPFIIGERVIGVKNASGDLGRFDMMSGNGRISKYSGRE